jgi:hypothetical protein
MFGLKGRQIFILLLLAAAIFAGTQIIPVYFRSYQFSDLAYQEVNFAVSKKESTEKVRAVIVELAKQYRIPIGPRDIHITRRGPSFTVNIEYELPVDLRVYQFRWPFHFDAAGIIFENDRN